MVNCSWTEERIIMKNGLIIDEYGNKRWYKNDLLHRTDGPAFISVNRHQVWYFENKKHRTDGPAIIYSNGYEIWYLNDKYLSHYDWLVALGHKKESL
jgi:hypothetical protein